MVYEIWTFFILNHMDTLNNTTRDQFMRIAMARLKSLYCFKPQRLAIAAKMYMKYLERKESTKSQNELSI
jgi:hypothetical protein